MRGFTLTETLVALLVVAILSGIAIPGYRGVLHRTLRSEARLALLQVRTLQERHYSSRLTYAQSLTAPPAAGGLGLRAETDSGLYRLRLQTSADGQHYVALAETLDSGRQSGDGECRQLSIDSMGVTDSAGADGTWRGAQDTCWQ